MPQVRVDSLDAKVGHPPSSGVIVPGRKHRPAGGPSKLRLGGVFRELTECAAQEILAERVGLDFRQNQKPQQ